MRKGLSIISVLVALVLMGILAMGILKLTKYQADSLVNNRLASQRDTLLGGLVRYAGSGGALIESASQAGNEAFSNCVDGPLPKTCASAPNCCMETGNQPMTLYSPKGSAYSGFYNENGESCTSGSPSCIFEVTATFTANCGGTAPCLQAQSIEIQYEIKQVAESTSRIWLKTKGGAISSTIPLVGGISGTPGVIPQFVTSSNLGDSILSQSGTEISINGTFGSVGTSETGNFGGKQLYLVGSGDSDGEVWLGSAPSGYAGHMQLNSSDIIFANSATASWRMSNGWLREGQGRLTFSGRTSGNFGGLNGSLTINNGSGGANDEIWIGPNGGSPTGHIQLVADDIYMTVDGGFLRVINGRVGISNAVPSYKLHVAGSVAGIGAYQNISDRRVKSEVQELKTSLEKILSLKPVRYKLKDDEENLGYELGFIAQDVEDVFPETISEDREGIKSLAYAQLIAPLVKAVQEQQKEILSLKAAIEKGQCADSKDR